MKNKIEQFASVERDFPSLLIQAQQYLLFRVDTSEVTPVALTPGQRTPPLPHAWALEASEDAFIFTQQEGAAPHVVKSPGQSAWPSAGCVTFARHLFPRVQFRKELVCGVSLSHGR